MGMLGGRRCLAVVGTFSWGAVALLTVSGPLVLLRRYQWRWYVLLSACPDAGPRPPCGHTKPRPAAPQVAVSLGGAWLIWSGFIFHRDVRNRRAAPSAAASREPVAVASVDSKAETALHGGWTQTSRVPSTGSRHCLRGDGDENSLTRLPIRPYLFSHFR